MTYDLLVKRLKQSQTPEIALLAEEIADAVCGSHDRREFGDLSGAGDVPIRFQGGVVVLTPYGCTYCGGGFWTENDRNRRLGPGLHPCPHCGEHSQVSA